MSSWVQLLAVLMMISLREGKAEGESLPAALVELVRNSPIASIQDLQQLLLSEAPDEDDESVASNSSMNRVPRSLEAQPAEQAQCKVRTEVTEVTRAMLDRSNADFLLWPPCVEVQRCSGCCNTKTLQCVPVLTHTRHLQVMKVQYMNKQPSYAKAVVSVVDHVECHCQPAPQPPAGAKKKPAPYRPGQEGQQEGQEGQEGRTKVRSKEELHRRDELKHIQLKQLLEQHWSPHWAGNSSSLGGRQEAGPGVLGGRQEAGPGVLGGRQEAGPGYAGTAQVGRRQGQSLLRNHTEGKKQGADGPPEEAPLTDRPPQRTSSAKQSRPRKGNASSEQASTTEAANQRQENRFRPTEETNQRQENRFRPTEETNQDLKGRVRDNDTPGWKGKVDLLLLEEQRRQRLNQEVLSISQHPATTLTAVPSETSTTSTRSPSSPPMPPGPARRAPPARPAPNPRKRMRNRKRISKAAMRAMLM